MLSSPLRGEPPAFSVGCREESAGHSPQAVEKSASGIRHRHCSGDCRTFSAGGAEESVGHSQPAMQECRACSAVH